MTTYVLTARLRKTLSRPLGVLVAGNEDECNRTLKQIIAEENPTKVILVGDTVSRNAAQKGIRADLMIIDNLEKRAKAKTYAFEPKRRIKTRNLPGMIEAQARETVEQAVLGGSDLIEVDGEEDLLAIVAVQTSPLGSLVVYGQPGEGIVLVRVSEAKKVEAQAILDQMEKRD
ncbi:MAG: GTP-dependent dephospho-CoA kinase family protein [Candidatus Bathyarchaeia archaeon]